MIKLDNITNEILDKIDPIGFEQKGAFNLRYNGAPLCHSNSENIRIEKKTDKQGIDIFISSKCRGEYVHIPVVMNETGLTDVVYNDFFVEDGADVIIVAGCGITNDGCYESRHDGIHAFHVGKNCTVKYIENHYAQGSGTGGRVLNPVTEIEVGEASVFTLETSQIGGVDSTIRKNYVSLGKDAKLIVTEKLLTEGEQSAESDMSINLDGENSSAQIISRSVGKGDSQQTFHPCAIGNNKCHAHVQCDSIIMDNARICSIPEIDAHHIDAAIVHEAAIGRINNDQLVKLMTLGLNEQEAEAVIIEVFLK